MSSLNLKLPYTLYVSPTYRLSLLLLPNSSLLDPQHFSFSSPRDGYSLSPFTFNLWRNVLLPISCSRSHFVRSVHLFVRFVAFVLLSIRSAIHPAIRSFHLSLFFVPVSSVFPVGTMAFL